MDDMGTQQVELEWQEPLVVFRPGLGNAIAGFIVAFLLIAGGLALVNRAYQLAERYNWSLPFYDKEKMCWFWINSLGLLGLALCVGAIFLVRYCLWLLAHRVEVYEEGFRYNLKEWRVVRWKDIVRMVEYFIVIGSNTSYEVYTHDGTKHEFNSNSIRRVRQFGNILRAKAADLGIAWQTVEQRPC